MPSCYERHKRIASKSGHPYHEQVHLLLATLLRSQRNADSIGQLGRCGV